MTKLGSMVVMVIEEEREEARGKREDRRGGYYTIERPVAGMVARGPAGWAGLESGHYGNHNRPGETVDKMSIPMKKKKRTITLQAQAPKAIKTNPKFPSSNRLTSVTVTILPYLEI